MIREEMLSYLFTGNYQVKHQLFSDDEYIYFDGDVIRDENDYNMGGLYDEFMEIRKGGNWETNWLAQERNVDAFDILGNGAKIIHNYNNIHTEGESDKPLKRGVYVAHKPRNLINRNDPCPCGSGKKYKRCCIN